MSAREELLEFLSVAKLEYGGEWQDLRRVDQKSAIRVRLGSETILFRFDADGQLMVPPPADPV